METRPKIQLNLSAFDRTLELSGKILLVVIWGLTIYIFSKLPTIIPVHFNLSGQADDYGNKKTILILPALATLIYFGLTQLSKYPHKFNYVTKINDDNAQKQYSIATRMLRFLKLAILLIFSVIILFTYLTTKGLVNGLGFWFIPLTFVLLIIPIAITIRQSLKKKNNLA